MNYILFKAHFSADKSIILEDREFMPLVKAAKHFVRRYFKDRKCTFTITSHLIKDGKEIDNEKIGPQQMCKFAYYPNGYFLFPGYERTKFMIFPEQLMYPRKSEL